MHFRAIVITLSLILITGCLSLTRPGKRRREEASARAAREFVAHRSKLEKVTFLVLASDRAASFGLNGSDRRLVWFRGGSRPQTTTRPLTRNRRRSRLHAPRSDAPTLHVSRCRSRSHAPRSHEHGTP